MKEAIFTITDVKRKDQKKEPPKPFITSSLQQEASNKLNFTTKQTMIIAQKLYEKGKITYMRTDSAGLSSEAMEMIKEEVTKLFGSSYYLARNKTNKVKGAQEAHECIRPTNFTISILNPDFDTNERKLYSLIWKRTMASQMAAMIFDVLSVKVGFDKKTDHFKSEFKSLKFNGYNIIYIDSKESGIDDKVLTEIKKGVEVKLKDSVGTMTYTNPPVKYTEASLVKKLEDCQIGRPSTYSSMINVVQDRGYVVKKNIKNKDIEIETIKLTESRDIVYDSEIKKGSNEKGKLIPTEIGIKVVSFLEEAFPSIMEYNFTTDLENQLDKLSVGDSTKTESIAMFYNLFEKEIIKMTKNTFNKYPSKKASGKMVLGQNQDGKQVQVMIGRFGPVIQVGGETKDDPCKFASIPKNISLDEVTLDQAIEIFDKSEKWKTDNPNYLDKYKKKKKK